MGEISAAQAVQDDVGHRKKIAPTDPLFFDRKNISDISVFTHGYFSIYSYLLPICYQYNKYIYIEHVSNIYEQNVQIRFRPSKTWSTYWV